MRIRLVVSRKLLLFVHDIFGSVPTSSIMLTASHLIYCFRDLEALRAIVRPCGSTHDGLKRHPRWPLYYQEDEAAVLLCLTEEHPLLCHHIAIFRHKSQLGLYLQPQFRSIPA